jgi:hypothetical protein
MHEGSLPSRDRAWAKGRSRAGDGRNREPRRICSFAPGGTFRNFPAFKSVLGYPIVVQHPDFMIALYHRLGPAGARSWIRARVGHVSSHVFLLSHNALRREAWRRLDPYDHARIEAKHDFVGHSLWPRALAFRPARRRPQDRRYRCRARRLSAAGSMTGPRTWVARSVEPVCGSYR